MFTILGDSNVRRNMTQMNCRAGIHMSGAQQISCGKLEVLAESLRAVRFESTICVLSCITNFLTSCSGSSSSVSVRIESCLSEVRDTLESACQENPERYFLICPPMYRLVNLRVYITCLVLTKQC